MAQAPGCPTPAQTADRADAAALKDVKLLAVVGSPNAGKSALFNALTGLYATVSN